MTTNFLVKPDKHPVLRKYRGTTSWNITLATFVPYWFIHEMLIHTLGGRLKLTNIFTVQICTRNWIPTIYWCGWPPKVGNWSVCASDKKNWFHLRMYSVLVNQTVTSSVICFDRKIDASQKIRHGGRVCVCVSVCVRLCVRAMYRSTYCTANRASNTNRIQSL